LKLQIGIPFGVVPLGPFQPILFGFSVGSEEVPEVVPRSPDDGGRSSTEVMLEKSLKIWKRNEPRVVRMPCLYGMRVIES
jgi:hypothetical protein